MPYNFSCIHHISNRMLLPPLLVVAVLFSVWLSVLVCLTFKAIHNVIVWIICNCVKTLHTKCDIALVYPIKHTHTLSHTPVNNFFSAVFASRSLTRSLPFAAHPRACVCVFFCVRCVLAQKGKVMKWAHSIAPRQMSTQAHTIRFSRNYMRCAHGRMTSSRKFRQLCPHIIHQLRSKISEPRIALKSWQKLNGFQMATITCGDSQLWPRYKYKHVHVCAYFVLYSNEEKKAFVWLFKGLRAQLTSSIPFRCVCVCVLRAGARGINKKKRWDKTKQFHIYKHFNRFD